MQTGIGLKSKEKLLSLHIIGSRQLGGAESFYLRLVRALNEQGGQTAMAVIRPNSPLRQVLDGEKRQFHVPMRNGWDLFSMVSIRRLTRETGADIVQSYMGRGSRLTRLPEQGHAIHVARLGGFYKIDGYYRHAHAWVGNTRELCDYLVRAGLPARRVYQIGNFVEPAVPSGEIAIRELRNSLDVPAEAVVLFSLGRFIDIKGFDDLLSAFAKLPPEFHGRPIFLVIAGDGPLGPSLLKQSRELQIDTRVRWAGWQSHPGPYFEMADIFVCPSSHETLGNVILEAWAHRLPVVSTRTPGGLELIAEGETGLLAPCKDPRGLANRLAELLEGGPSGWEPLADRGAHALKNKHGKEAVVGQYLAMYQELLQSRRG
jgi:glycosyltransferase involved in cell wall biosynthesis